MAPAAAPFSADAKLEKDFEGTVHPFLATYCYSCHSGPKPQAELDLSSFKNLDMVVADSAHWDRVLDRVSAGEMPPEKAPKYPTTQDRQAVVNWVQTMRKNVALKNAGDPGPVLARRLSNAEYDYTIHDLTGVDIQPAKEFPVDPANEAGFDNSGESLAMSPSMVKKYLEAARAVASHMVLTPTGIDFAPFPIVTDDDRDKYGVNRVVDFYHAQHVSYVDFFTAVWQFQHRAELGRPMATLDDFARDANLSPKYLATLLAVLTAPDETVGPMAALQARWKKLPAPVAGKAPPALAEGITQIRGFINDLRPYVAQEFANLPMPGRSIASGSQTTVLWKDQQFATTRMTYPTGKALTVDMSFYAQTDPLMLIPKAAADTARYEDSFKRFCAVFPDSFYVQERARMFLIAAKDIASDLAGHRLLTAGFHSQMGYFRDDAPLCTLILNDAQNAELNRLWQELNFVSDVPIRQYQQFLWFERGEPPSFMVSAEFNEFRPEDGDITSEVRIKKLAEVYTAKAVKAGVTGASLQAVKDYFVSMNTVIRAHEASKLASEPLQLQALMTFASRAFRRPLSAAEQDDLLAFYHTLRGQKLDHQEALRDALVSVLMSPYFCYRIDLVDSPAVALPAGGASRPTASVRTQSHDSVLPTGVPAPLLVSARLTTLAAASPANPAGTQPLTDYDLASRLSYFLWSSMPDAELLAHAAAGDLHRPEVISAQARRMLTNPRMKNFATEFGGNWLDFRRFEEINTVDRATFPQFTNDLREAMFQEPVRFLADLVEHNGSVLDLVYGNYTFVNPELAKLYGMPVPAATTADQWVRVDGADKYGRGGLLPMAAFLTEFAPGLRTSPVKRGHWVVTRVLGEVIPSPPPNVPVLPNDEKKLGDLTLAQALARHHSDPACASCHEKFDSFGLVFEGYGPVGEIRSKDLADRPVQVDATFPDGTKETGLKGLRDYLHTKVQGEFVDNLCRKLAAYGLGRTLRLSDDSLIVEMNARLAADQDRFGSMVDTLVTSSQFLNKRVSPAPGGLANN